MEPIPKKKKRCDVHSVGTHIPRLAGQTNLGKKSQYVKKSSQVVEDETFLVPNGTTDVILVVEGEELYTNQVILAMVSPVFDKMFQSDFKEKQEQMVELPGKKFQDVLLLLRLVCHKVKLDDLKTAEISSVLPLAHEYQISFLIADCVQRLGFLARWNNITRKECFDILNMAVHYSLEKLQNDCLWNLTRNVDIQIETSTMYKALSPNVKVLLLELLVEQMRCNLRRVLAESKK